MAYAGIKELYRRVRDREAKINSLNIEIKALKIDWEARDKQKDETHKTEVDELKTKISGLEDENKQKQDQLNKRELKKLAEAYSEQERLFADSAKNWAIMVTISFATLAGSVLLSAYFASGKSWHDKIEFYLINFVILTFIVFALKQYSYVTKLRTNYANRKTIAQSYQNILTSTDDEPIKNQFLEKATSVLTAPADIDHEAFTLSEKGIEKLIETLSSLAKNKAL